jgi:hypothetical protein
VVPRGKQPHFNQQSRDGCTWVLLNLLFTTLQRLVKFVVFASVSVMLLFLSLKFYYLVLILFGLVKSIVLFTGVDAQAQVK